MERFRSINEEKKPFPSIKNIQEGFDMANKELDAEQAQAPVTLETPEAEESQISDIMDGRQVISEMLQNRMEQQRRKAEEEAQRRAEILRSKFRLVD